MQRLERSSVNKKTQNANYSASENDVIDLLELFDIAKKKIYIFIILGVLGAMVAGLYTKFMINPTYASQGTIYLTPLVSQSGIADYNSINVNSRLVDTVMSLMKKDNILNVVAEETGMSSAAAVRSCLSISNEDNTEIITVRATTTDPELSKNIATTTINVFIDKMQENLNVKNIEIVDAPKPNYKKVGPNLTRNVMFGGVFGLAISFVYVSFLLLTDNRLKSKEQAEKYLGYPVFIEIPKWK